MGFTKTCNVTNLLRLTYGNNSPFILLPQDPSVAILDQDSHHLWCLCPQTSTVAQLAQPCNSPVVKLMAALRWATRHPGAVICCCGYTKGALFGLKTGMCPGHRQDQGLPLGLQPGPSPEGGPPLSKGVCQAQDHQDVLILEHRARFPSTCPLSQGSGWFPENSWWSVWRPWTHRWSTGQGPSSGESAQPLPQRDRCLGLSGHSVNTH